MYRFLYVKNRLHNIGEILRVQVAKIDGHREFRPARRIGDAFLTCGRAGPRRLAAKQALTDDRCGRPHIFVAGVSSLPDEGVVRAPDCQ